MTDASDEETLKRIVFWDHIDRTVRVAVSEYSFHARNFVLPQFKGSDEERSALEQAIATLEPAIETIVERLARHIRRDGAGWVASVV